MGIDTAESHRPSPSGPGVLRQFGRLSVVALVASNLVPLFGVLWAGWSMFRILLLFSLENIVIGFYNLLRMCVAPCNLAELRQSSSGGIRTKWGLIAFFCVHYGMFTVGHLVFVLVLFGTFLGEGLGPASPAPPWSAADGMPGHADLGEALGNLWPGIGLALLALWISHGVSFVRNFLLAGEYKRVAANDLMLRPYARVMVMHVTIVLGAFIVMATGTPLALLVLLVALKILVDLIAHLWERKKFQTAQAPRQAPRAESN